MRDDKFEEKLSPIVAIRSELRQGLPFSLKTRNGIAIVLSFFGDTEEVSEFM